jgi:ammonia channel protein AmtB
MRMLGPSGKTVSVGQRDLANTHGVCGSVALIQIGIFGEEFRLCRHPIGWLVEIQFLAIGNVLDSIMHLGVNLFAILAGSQRERRAVR